MDAEHKEKNLELERLVFFSDAVVAIAITLLALELRIEPEGEHLAFSDLAHAWHKFAAFLVSFIAIAVFWINHHRFFVYIKAIDSRLMVYNMCWLLFIVLLPVSSSLVSNDFFNHPAMIVYSLNVLAISVFQNMIWDHLVNHKELSKPNLTDTIEREYRIGCNLAMGNAGTAIALSFLSPVLAFITLLFRSLMFRRSAQQYLARLTAKRAARIKGVGRNRRTNKDQLK
ncbi:MAG: DUF1211 domain-containing protein [Sphingobacteriales bacterium]|nr:MAG: DUF1211 domain-containing protein [Sphingobacteriales bacterium]